MRNDLRILIAQADLRTCDLIVKGVLDRRRVGFFYNANSKTFMTARKNQQPATLSQLTKAIRQNNAILTFTAVPHGSGQRLGIDRDADGILDGDE